MASIRSLVMKRGEPRFNMVGQKLPDSLRDLNEVISQGLVQRLHRYALERLVPAGFAVTEWSCEVSTMDGDELPPDRYYIVTFTNPLGGALGVQGIATSKGWPCLDHGVFVEIGDPPLSSPSVES